MHRTCTQAPAQEQLCADELPFPCTFRMEELHHIAFLTLGTDCMLGARGRFYAAERLQVAALRECRRRGGGSWQAARFLDGRAGIRCGYGHNGGTTDAEVCGGCAAHQEREIVPGMYEDTDIFVRGFRKSRLVFGVRCRAWYSMTAGTACDISNTRPPQLWS
jgi:hypothetical protein